MKVIKTKKRLLLLAVVAVFVMSSVVLVACGSKVPDSLVGDWNCEEMASDGSTYTGNYRLTINEDGTFEMKDKESGENMMSGSMKGKDTGKIGILEINLEEEGFNPPSCWGLRQKDQLRYKVEGSDSMKLGCDGIWLIFEK